MKEVRLLETEIVTYQNELRTNIQRAQMKEYLEIGQEQMQDFYKAWEENFKIDEEEALAKI
jgi:hypothetical protein